MSIEMPWAVGWLGFERNGNPGGREEAGEEAVRIANPVQSTVFFGVKRGFFLNLP
jgi:hypothetical protein